MFQIPPGHTAMIGSLPYHDTDSAFAVLEKLPLDIATWFQMPAVSYKEGMLIQYTEGLPGVEIDEKERKIFVQKNEEFLMGMADSYEQIVNNNTEFFAMSAEFALGFQPFIDWAKAKGKKLPFVKGQVVGPYTLGLGVNDNNLKALWFDPQYAELILGAMVQKALWQIDKLSEVAEKVIISFDEPIFSALGTPAYMGISDDDVMSVLNTLAEAIHAKGAAMGVHCCGNMDWGILARSEIDIISFDAFEFGDKVALYASDIKTFLENGKYLAWGLVPTADDNIVSGTNNQALINKEKSLSDIFIGKGIDKVLLQQQRIFTPACGLGNLTVESAEKVLGQLAGLKEMFG